MIYVITGITIAEDLKKKKVTFSVTIVMYL